MSSKALIGGAIGAAVAAILAYSSLFQVQQTEQTLVFQFGQFVRNADRPGLHAKLPFVQTIVPLDKRLLDFERPGEEVILGDQRRLIVDTFTRYRISDPLRFYQSVVVARATSDVERATRDLLAGLVSSSLRRVLGNEPLLSVLSADRARIMAEIHRVVDEEARRFGLTVEDVRIRRADLPEENFQAILQRMQTERERVAREARSEGAEVGQRIRAAAERERTVLLAEAQARADAIRGQGEQEAIGIYAEAFNRDREFFAFWRTMQAYREAFGDGGARMILSPDSEFFRYFRDLPGAPPRENRPAPAAAVR